MKNLSAGVVVVGLLSIVLAFCGVVHGGSLIIAGAILVSAGIVAMAILEGRKAS